MLVPYDHQCAISVILMILNETGIAKNKSCITFVAVIRCASVVQHHVNCKHGAVCGVLLAEVGAAVPFLCVWYVCML